MNDIISPNMLVERDPELDRTGSGTALIPAPSMTPLASATTQQFCTALAIAQGEFKAPKRTKTANVKGTTARGQPYEYSYKYAPLEELIDSIKEGLAKNGLSRQQYLVYRGGTPFIRTIIWHASGEWIASDYPVHPSKEGAQGFASGVTMARRYGLSLALGLAPEDDDDANIADGNIPGTVANGNGKPTTVVKPTTAPLPQTPPLEPPMDQTTGEVSPHTIEVPLTQRGASDWIKWGGQVVAALQASRDRSEVEAWVAEQKAALKTCEGDFPKVHARVSANIEEARKRFPDAGETEPQFMQPSDMRTGSRYANVG